MIYKFAMDTLNLNNLESAGVGLESTGLEKQAYTPRALLMECKWSANGVQPCEIESQTEALSPLRRNAGNIRQRKPASASKQSLAAAPSDSVTG
jgi:hypothetical protein